MQVLEHEHVYLDALPSSQMYEKSYMHRDVVTHVVSSTHRALGPKACPLARSRR